MTNGNNAMKQLENSLESLSQHKSVLGAASPSKSRKWKSTSESSCWIQNGENKRPSSILVKKGALCSLEVLEPLIRRVHRRVRANKHNPFQPTFPKTCLVSQTFEQTFLVPRERRPKKRRRIWKNSKRLASLVSFGMDMQGRHLPPLKRLRLPI
jgi:hypothetical protein